MNCCLFFYYIDCVSNGPFAKQVGDITFNQEDFRLNIDIDAVQWPHGKGIPADSPECGFDDLGCVVTSTDITPTTPDDNSKIGRLFYLKCRCLSFNDILFQDDFGVLAAVFWHPF